MSKLRDEIKDAIKSNIDYREGVAYEGEVAWREGWWEWDKAADAILALVREALLAPEFEGPLHRAMSTWTAQTHIYRHREGGEPTHEAAMDIAGKAITAALDAVTGEGDR